MTVALIKRDDTALTIRFTEAAEAMAAEALDTAALIGRVSTPEENDRAVEAQKKLKGATALVEKARKEAKDPVLEFGRKIDASAKTFCAPLEAEFLRVSKIVGDFQQLEEAKRKAAEAARLLEIQRIEQERQAEINRIAKEEVAARLKLEAEAAEARRKADAAKTKAEAEEAARITAELKRQEALSVAASHERMEAVNEKFNLESASVPIVEAPTRAKGQSVQQVVVIDQIREFELMKARPDLVRRVEFDLIEIKKLLAHGVKLAGVTFHTETKANVRTSPGTVLELIP